MGILDGLFGGGNINDGVEEARSSDNAVLVDVRTPGEYAEGHIPDSVNVPLDTIPYFEKVVPDKDTHIFLYCASGARSSHAASMLQGMGYTDVTNIGGISRWHGEIER